MISSIEKNKPYELVRVQTIKRDKPAGLQQHRDYPKVE